MTVLQFLESQLYSRKCPIILAVLRLNSLTVSRFPYYDDYLSICIKPRDETETYFTRKQHTARSRCTILLSNTQGVVLPFTILVQWDCSLNRTKPFITKHWWWKIVGANNVNSIQTQPHYRLGVHCKVVSSCFMTLRHILI